MQPGSGPPDGQAGEGDRKIAPQAAKDGQKRLEVVVLGEALVDFISLQPGAALIDASRFARAAGGAPANVAVGVARLGGRAGFVGKVGADVFGRFLARTLGEEGVDILHLLSEPSARTALAFVALRQDGETDFTFFGHPSADMLLEPKDIDPAYLATAKVLHIGSISLSDEPARSATLYALQLARDLGLWVSYDPNLRLPLWPDPESAREGILAGWKYADIAKLSLAEARFLSRHSEPRQAADVLWGHGLRCLVITLGPEGCFYRTDSAEGFVPGHAVRAVDTTGAGDGFAAGLLTQLVESDFQLDTPWLLQSLRFANAVAALTTTRRGAIAALPRRSRVERFLRPQEE